MKIIIFLLISSFSLVGINVAAEEDGRYRAVILEQSGGSDHHGKVFIVDSRDGHMWTWEDKSKYTTRQGGIAFGAKIVYQGKLIPGKKMGEILDTGEKR